MPRKSPAKLYVVLTGAQIVLDSFVSSLSQSLGFYDRNGTRAFEDAEFVLNMRRQLHKARAALDLMEVYLNKSCGTHPKATKPKIEYIKDIEGCPDWPEGDTDAPDEDE